MESENETSVVIPLEKSETGSEVPSETGHTSLETPNPIPIESPSTPSIQGSDESVKEQPSIVSFFGKSAGLTPANNLKLNLTIDLSPLNPKRPKMNP